ncbi:hypothetical protein ABPG74_006745 [Tetrahymena malaccensis]
MKYKYGDKVKVLFSIGKGILKFYNQSLTQNKDSIGFIRNMHQKGLKAIAFNLGTKVGLSFLDPELQKQVHQSYQSFRRIDAIAAMTYLLGNSMIYATDKEWKRQRLFLGKFFHFDEIKNYYPTIQETTKQVLQGVDQQLNHQEKIEIKAVYIIQKITSEATFKMFFGLTTESLKVTRKDGTQIAFSEELALLIRHSFQLLQTDKIALLKWILLKRKSTQCFSTKGERELMDRLRNLRQGFIQIVSKRKEELSQDPYKAKNNFLDYYLTEMIQNQQCGITYDEIVDNFTGIFLAGTDTTSNMVGSALYYLSINPEVQQQARKEVITFLSSKYDLKKPDQLASQIRFEDITHFNFLNCILKESLRLIPPVIQITSRIANHNMKIGEFDIKKGDLVTTNFAYNLSNPDIFPNPEQFNPQRWMTANNYQETFSFTPFSYGPRNCIGQHLAMIEGKSILASILLKYEILPNSTQEVIMEMKMMYGFQNDNLIYFKKLKY